jgi:hypothetical protein
MNRVSRRAGIASALILLALPGVASAAPGSRSFEQTYPVASNLCSEATLPASLQGQQAQVSSDCTTLQNAYNAAVAAGQSAEASFAAAVQAAHSAAQAACTPVPTTAAGRAACRQARAKARAEVAAQRVGLRLALRQFHLSIEQARVTFWTAIHNLRGGASIPGDSPTPNAPIPTGTSSS